VHVIIYSTAISASTTDEQAHGELYLRMVCIATDLSPVNDKLQ